MAYSYFDYEGTDTTIQTDILCVSTEHMYAFKVLSEEKSKVTLSDVALAATFTKNNAGVLCELNTAPSTKIRVIRSTPYDVLMHDFSNGAQFNADSVDEAYLNYRWVDEQTIEFSEELTGVVQFVRTTSLEDNLVKFKESPITADYVDTNNTQLLHIIQEILGGTLYVRATLRSMEL